MKLTRTASLVTIVASIASLFGWRISRGQEPIRSKEASSASLTAQVPSWSREDLDFFLHGSMGTEFVPEKVLRAFVRTYPDLFHSGDFKKIGLIPDSDFGWPVGFSRRDVPHLGNMPAVGINCAACHVTEVMSNSNDSPVRVLGVTAHFDAEAFFGAVIGATFLSSDPVNMKRFLSEYLKENDPVEGERMQSFLTSEWQRQEAEISRAMTADPSGSKDLEPAALHELDAEDDFRLRLDHRTLAAADLSAIAHSFLKLFHNMRAALHVRDQPPEKAPPASGPGRNDAFGLLSAGLFGKPQPYAPVKYGLLWNLDQRHWVHWDGNTQSPIGRNLLASFGLGAPIIGKKGQLDLASVHRHTALTQRIRAPRYPFAFDSDAASRGAAHFQAHCAACHDGPETDHRLYDVSEIGTDPLRAELFTQLQADRFNKFLSEIEMPGYAPSSKPGIRGTQKYWAPTLAGVWARSPYLHNGSVRTMRQLLGPPAERAKTFHRGSHVYDPAQMGYTDEGAYLLDTGTAGNSNSGHEYGADLSVAQRQDLIEYLKTL